MNRVRLFFSCVALASVAALAISICLLVLSVKRAADAFPDKLDRAAAAVVTEIQQTRGAAIGEIDRQLNGLRADFVGQVGSLRSDTFTRVDRTLEVADARIGQSLELLDSRSADTLKSISSLQADLQPSFRNIANLTGHADEAAAVLFRRDALPAQLLGLTGAAKITLGETAQTMRTIQAAAPELLAGASRLVDNSDQTTAATAVAMKNLAEATKPLPKWLRYPLAITGAMAPTVAGAVSAAAATGAFK